MDFPILIVFILALFTNIKQAFVICTASDRNLKLIPDKSVQIIEGENIHIRCTCDPCHPVNFSMPLGYLFRWEYTKTTIKEDPKGTCNKVFECSEQSQILCSAVCDGIIDCTNGLDELNCFDKADLSSNISNSVLGRVHQLRYPLDTQNLVIKDARQTDSGYYNCVLKEFGGDIVSRSLHIHVVPRGDGPHISHNVMCYGQFRCRLGPCIDKKYVCDGTNHCKDGSDEDACQEIKDSPHLNCDKVFKCSEKRKIPCADVCDGKADCANSLDEINCTNSPRLNCDKVFKCSEKRKIPCADVCDGKADCANFLDEINCTIHMCFGQFRCKNGLCIDKKYVCDVTGGYHCIDGSDEDNCPAIKDDVEIFAKDKQMDWLKTTVYTVIACTVGVVLLIAIIVVAIFRIKMKRNAVRRAFRQSDQHRRNSDRHGRQSARATRNSMVEHEPFISAPSPTHFGNIIVNVNNGVQFIPSSELSAALQMPPSYSEVIAMETRGRHSPPPDYSTIDRNPRDLDDLPAAAESECQQLQTSTTDTVIHTESNDTSEHGETRGGHSMQSFSADDLQVAPLGAASRPEGTSSLGRRNCSQAGSRDRQIRNVRAHPLPQRPKQLQVRNGQIVLDGASSGSSSPETVNRNTQTIATDLNTLQQNLAKPGQLHVERGHIILSSPVDGDTITADAGDLDLEGACSVQGQLEVKEGQIVFKAT